MSVESHRPWGYLVALLLSLLAVEGLVLWDSHGRWGEFYWKNIEGPALADAHGWSVACQGKEGAVRGSLDPPLCPQGSTLPARPGYTLASELLYALLGLWALFLLYTHFFLRLRIPLDLPFAVSFTPLLLAGSLARVLEDAAAFCRAGTVSFDLSCTPNPWSYLWIAPFEYYQLGPFFLAGLLWGVFLERTRSRSPHRLLPLVAFTLLFEVALFTLLFLAIQPSSLPPFSTWGVGGALGGAGVGFLLFLLLHERAPLVPLTLSTLTFPLLGAEVGLVLSWPIEGPWAPVLGKGAIGAAWISLLLSLLVALGAFALGGLRWAFALRGWGNLLIIFGQALDGITTWIIVRNPLGFDLPAYGEKHPVSALLLEAPPHGEIYPLVKISLALLVAFLLEHRFEPRARTWTEKNLVGVLRITLIALGLVPGTRSLLRVLLGV